MRALRKILPFLIFLSACAAPKALVYRGVEGFKFESVTLEQTRMGLSVKFFNPNSYGVQLKGGDSDVFLNSKYAGKSELVERMEIPGNTEFLVPLTLTADMKSILGSALGILLKNEVEVRLQGTVRAGRNGVFVPVPVNFVTKQKINIR